jgi:hypothetical protein
LQVALLHQADVAEGQAGDEQRAEGVGDQQIGADQFAQGTLRQGLEEQRRQRHVDDEDAQHAHVGAGQEAHAHRREADADDDEDRAGDAQDGQQGGTRGG